MLKMLLAVTEGKATLRSDLSAVYWVSLYFVCTGKQHLKKENTKIFISEFCIVIGITVGSLLMTRYEYAAEYLERYEFDFIVDYTERYANGDFTEAELLWMQTNCYRDTYVIDIAKKYQ